MTKMHFTTKKSSMVMFEIVLVLLMLSAMMAVAETPPSLTDFHQFYGQVTNLPEGPFALKAVVENRTFTTAIAADGKYGYSPTFKVSAGSGAVITFFVVDQLRTETRVGTASYRQGEVTMLDFSYPRSTVNISADEQQNGSATNGTTTSGGSSISSRRQNDSVSPAGSCLQSWECGVWSDCSGGVETRTCRRVDNCDARRARGEVATITSVPKPVEQRFCEEVSDAAVAGGVCAAGTKRCSANAVERCAVDGRSWQLLEVCAEGCDPAALRCTSSTSEVTGIKTPSSRIYLVVGIVVILTIVIVVAVFHRKKYGPVKAYIAHSRESGVSDAQIKSRLLGQGWKVKKVDSLLK